MAKIIKTLWEHKKKTIFLVGGGYYGLDYLYDRHKTFLMVRALCHESLEQGRRSMPLNGKNKHITLILNPVAANRKAKSKFEKYAEAMLNLSGFMVTNVRTERIFEATNLIELIDRTNVIAVAGGDGTLFEAVTGLLRREDADEATKRFPIAIIPVGVRNIFAKRLTGKQNATDPELISECAMAVVRHRIRPQDVLQIQVVEPLNTSKEEGQDVISTEERKPVFSMSGITLGQFREADHISTTMPGIFPDKFCTFWSLLRASRKQFKAEIKYTPPCSGCLKCVKEVLPNESSLLSRVSSFLRRPKPYSETKMRTENPECGTWNSICVDSLEFNIRPKGNGNLEVEIGVNTGWTEFMREGFRRSKGQPPTLSHKFECSQVEVIPLSSPEFCSIDYEEFEVKPLTVKVLRDKVYFFTH